MPRQPVPLAARAQAMVIDGLLMLATSSLLMWLAYGQPIARWDDVRPLSLLINWGLPALVCLVFWPWQGATPGKLVVGLKVVDGRSGRRPGLVQSLLRWLAYWISLLPLGLGFWWAAVDTRGRTWHDRLSGTEVESSRVASGDGRGWIAAYIGAHWRGEQSLPQSYWVNNVLLAVPLFMALNGLMSWISLKGEALQAGSIAILLGWPLMVVLNVWCIVGAWRAAREYARIDGSPLWTFLTRLSLVLNTLQLAVSVGVGFIPQLDEYWKMARGIDPIGQARLNLSTDGRTLQLNGPIGMGDATRMEKLLAGAPQLRLVELASPGGRVVEAERMVEMVKKRGASTRAVGSCASACTLVFLAGSQRQLMPGARLGFHRASSGTYNPMFDEMANQQLASTYRRMQLPEYFIDKTLKTPANRMWWPKSDELVAHALIAAPSRTLDIALPESGSPTAPAPVGDYREALRANPAWYALEERFPGLLERTAARMLEARAALSGQPGEADATQMAAQLELAPQVREMLVEGSPDSRLRYLRLARDQLGALLALDRDACQAWLAGSPAPRRLLPEALVARETQWLIAAAAEPAPLRNRPPRATPVELEVVHRTVGGQAPGLLSRLWSVDGGPVEAEPAAQADARSAKAVKAAQSVTCERAGQILDQISRLPVAQRELAQRLALLPVR